VPPSRLETAAVAGTHDRRSGHPSRAHQQGRSRAGTAGRSQRSPSTGADHGSPGRRTQQTRSDPGPIRRQVRRHTPKPAAAMSAPHRSRARSTSSARAIDNTPGSHDRAGGRLVASQPGLNRDGTGTGRPPQQQPARRRQAPRFPSPRIPVAQGLAPAAAPPATGFSAILARFSRPRRRAAMLPAFSAVSFVSGAGCPTRTARWRRGSLRDLCRSRQAIRDLALACVFRDADLRGGRRLSFGWPPSRGRRRHAAPGSGGGRPGERARSQVLHGRSEFTSPGAVEPAWSDERRCGEEEHGLPSRRPVTARATAASASRPR